MNRVLRTAYALASLLVLAACEREPEFGPARTEQRAVSSFESINMQGDARLEVRVGTTTSLQLEGVDLVLQQTQTRVENGTLYIDNRNAERRWLKRVRPVQIVITVPHLTNVAVLGGNDMRLSGFEGGEVAFEIGGAAHVDARGRLDRLTINMQGAGVADFEELVATRATVRVHGVGTAYVHATEVLDATMNGVGTILYSGEPAEVKTSMNGLGKVGKRGEDAGRERRQRGRESPDADQPHDDNPVPQSDEPTIEV